jgi:hypothetical protein
MPEAPARQAEQPGHLPVAFLLERPLSEAEVPAAQVTFGHAGEVGAVVDDDRGVVDQPLPRAPQPVQELELLAHRQRAAGAPRSVRKLRTCRRSCGRRPCWRRCRSCPRIRRRWCAPRRPRRSVRPARRTPDATTKGGAGRSPRIARPPTAAGVGAAAKAPRSFWSQSLSTATSSSRNAITRPLASETAAFRAWESPWRASWTYRSGRPSHSALCTASAVPSRGVVVHDEDLERGLLGDVHAPQAPQDPEQAVPPVVGADANGHVERGHVRARSTIRGTWSEYTARGVVRPAGAWTRAGAPRHLGA